MATRRHNTKLGVLILAILLMAAGSGQAALIHSFVADDDSAGTNSTATWHDLTGSKNWTFPAPVEMSLNSVTGSTTTFTETYTASNENTAGAWADPMIANVTSTGSVSVWFRQDPGGTDDFQKTLFEDGGNKSGFTLLFRRSSGSLSLFLSGSSIDNDLSVSLDSFDHSDFIQGTVSFDGTNANLYAYAAADGTNVSGSAANAGSLGGSNGAGLFNGGNNNNQAVGGSGDSGATGVVFDGDIAAVFLYDHALSQSEIETQFNAYIIPEPGTLSLIGIFAIGGALFLRRRYSARK